MSLSCLLVIRASLVDQSLETSAAKPSKPSKQIPDVVKSRIMASGGAANAHAVIYSGTLDCLVKTVRTEGVLALWKGFLPCWGRLGPWQVWASA